MIMYNPNKPDEKQAVKELIDEMMRKAIALEGTVSVNNSTHSTPTMSPSKPMGHACLGLTLDELGGTRYRFGQKGK